MNKPKKEWIEEVREILESYNMPDTYLNHEIDKWMKVVNDLLSQQAEEIVEKIEKIQINSLMSNDYIEGQRNMADTIITKIKSRYEK
jgi:hypothetical protein